MQCAHLRAADEARGECVEGHDLIAATNDAGLVCEALAAHVHSTGLGHIHHAGSAGPDPHRQLDLGGADAAASGSPWGCWRCSPGPLPERCAAARASGLHRLLL